MGDRLEVIQNSFEVLKTTRQLPPEHQFIDRSGIAAVKVPDLIHPSPFLAISLKRSANVKPAEHKTLADFQDELAKLNDGYFEDEDGVVKRRVKPDDYHSSLSEAKNLHVTILLATDVGQIVLRSMCNDKGEVINSSKVEDRLKRAAKKITNSAARDSIIHQKRALKTMKQYPTGRWGDTNSSDLEASPVPMTNGIFRVSKDIDTFGRGNVFGLTFESEAVSYFAEEREKALGIILDVLGIRNLDSDLEDTIRSREPHVSLIRMGLRIPRDERRLILPPAVSGRIVPRTFVTDLDPKARAVISNAKQ
jgi:hypothetical protein